MVGQGLQEPSSDEKQGNDKENPFVSIDWRASLVPVPADERLERKQAHEIKRKGRRFLDFLRGSREIKGEAFW